MHEDEFPQVTFIQRSKSIVSQFTCVVLMFDFNSRFS